MIPEKGKSKIVSEKVISEDWTIAEVFNKFFINIVPNFKISPNHNYETDFIVTNDQVTNALNKFRNYQSIIMRKENHYGKEKLINAFLFSPVTYEDILKNK